MPRYSGAPDVYPVAEQFVERCLRTDDSLFVPGRQVWSLETIVDAYHRFIDQPDLGDRDFIAKLKDQLDGSSDDTKLLVAELLYFHLLGEFDSGGPVKRDRIGSILGWMAESVAIPADMAKALDRGIGSSAWAKNRRDAQVAWLLEFARQWKSQEAGHRAAMLTDPWALEEFVHGLPKHSASIPIEATLHLVFPDVFEPLFSINIKRKIASAFGASDSSIPLDRRLAEIRAELEEEVGPFDAFYDPAIRERWETPSAPGVAKWDTFVEWASKIFATEGFDHAERDYKLEVAANVQQARESLASGDADWLAALRRAFGPPSNETDWRVHGAFLDWCEANPDEARALLHEVWAGEPSRERLGRLLEGWGADNSPGNRLNVLSFLLAGIDKTRYPAYRARADDGARRLLGLPKAGAAVGSTTQDVSTPEELASALGVPGIKVRNVLRERFPRAQGEKWSRWRLTPEQIEAVVQAIRPGLVQQQNAWDRYGAFLELLDELIHRLGAYEPPIRDRLDAQGLVWWIVAGDPPATWTDADKAAFLAWRDGQADHPLAVDEPARGPRFNATDELAERVLVDRAWLQEVLDLLSDKRQVVFYGPPGTGKTLIAQVLGEHVTTGGGYCQLTQFHPSYAYEDFMEGYRPLLSADGAVSYELRHGPLRRIAEQARRDSGNPHVLIVDEINRGNIPKIFGELLFLLEYRERAIALQYSEEPFSLPSNLYLIGTMNTADRSIALIDAALRRRFYFVPFLPREAPVKDVLRRWLAANGRDDRAAQLLDVLNEKLAGGEISIGPSYLMSGDGSDASLRRIWRYSIMPLLEEHFYDGKREVASEFGFEACLAAISEQSAEERPGIALPARVQVEDEPSAEDGAA